MVRSRSVASLKWKEGVCGATTFSSSAQDCENGISGAWHMSKLTRRDEDALRESCVERCMRCARCRFISFSIVWGDCSWYHDCEMGALKTELGGTAINGYSSARVRETVAVLPPAAGKMENLQAGVNFQGHDLRGVRVHTVEQCRLACDSLEACKAFTFITAELGKHGKAPIRCWLKHAGFEQDAAPASGTVSGVKSATNQHVHGEAQNGNTTRVQFVHITSAAGTAIEQWGRRYGFRWGKEHPALKRFVMLSSPLHRSIYGYNEMWHTPPSLLGNAAWPTPHDRNGIYRQVREGVRGSSNACCIVIGSGSGPGSQAQT